MRPQLNGGTLRGRADYCGDWIEMLEDFDFDDIWEPSEYADQNYVDDPLTPEKVSAVEEDRLSHSTSRPWWTPTCSVCC
jgi:hypothetical protein